MHDTKYYPGCIKYFYCGRDLYLFYSLNTGKISFIPKNIAERFYILTGCKTLEKHAEDSGFTDDKEDFFNLLIAENLLIPFFPKKSANNVLTKDKSVAADTNEIILTIVTHNRPELLGRCLHSISFSQESSLAKPNISVFDDSTDKKVLSLNMKTINSYKNLDYFSNYDKNIFLTSLAEKTKKYGIKKELLYFALNGTEELSDVKGPGGNRNSVLLKNAGKKILSIDDDVELNIKQTTLSNNKKIEFSSGKIPEINIFDDIKKANLVLMQSKFDPVYFSRLIGNSALDISYSEQPPDSEVSTEYLSPEMALAVEKNGIIKTAMAGIYGGRWFNRTAGIYMNRGSHRNSSFKKRSSYNKLKESPVCVMAASNIMLSDAPFLAASAFSIDTSEIIPPFPPHGRNEDSIWASILLAINKYSFIAYIPEAVYHIASNKKPFTAENYEDVSPDFGLLTMLIIEHLKITEFNLLPSVSLNRIGKTLVFLSHMSDSEWLSFCHSIWIDYVGKIIEELEILLDSYNSKPSFWAKDIKKYLNQLEKHALGPLIVLPKELTVCYTAQEAGRRYRDFFKYYGELIEAWPYIWEEALLQNDGRIKQ